jgi:hypothetical protein
MYPACANTDGRGVVWILLCTVAATSTSQGEGRLNAGLNEDSLQAICGRAMCSM